MPDACIMINSERIPNYYSFFTQYAYREHYTSEGLYYHGPDEKSLLPQREEEREYL
jgi:hypothetical protein